MWEAGEEGRMCVECVCRVEEALGFLVDALAGGENGRVHGLCGVCPLLRVFVQSFAAGRIGAEELVVDLVAEFGRKKEQDGLILRGHRLRP